MAEAETAFALQLCGTARPVPTPRRLVAGGLSCLLDGAAVRSVRWHGTEVIRGVAYLLRDAEWGTAASEVRDLRVEGGDGRFDVRFQFVIAQRDAQRKGQARIFGTAQGNLGSQPRELKLHGAWRARRPDVPVFVDALKACGPNDSSDSSNTTADVPTNRRVNGTLQCAPFEVALLQP